MCTGSRHLPKKDRHLTEANPSRGRPTVLLIVSLLTMSIVVRLDVQTVLSEPLEDLTDTATPRFVSLGEWWVEEDLNLRPHAYQACALTT